MPRVTIRDVGQFGVILDKPFHEIPPEAWSRVSNIRFFDKKAGRIFGETDVLGPPATAPYYIFPSPSETQPFWVYTDKLKVYAAIGGGHTDITRVSGDYTGGPDDRWNGGWLGGVLILNNGVDDPQQWLPISTGQRLVPLANWPAATKAKVIRMFQNFVFALDITASGTRYATTVRWSHPADAGSVPVSWDIADATKLAGELPLSDTPGFVIDGLSIGSSFMVYKEDAIVRLDRIQTNDVFAARWVSRSTGIMGQQCCAEFLPGKHVVLTLDGDVVVTDGSQVESIIDDINRTALERRMDGANRSKSVLAVNFKAHEVYVAYPRSGSVLCNEAAVWNRRDGTWSFRDLTPLSDLKAGLLDENAPSDIWNTDSQPWNFDTTRWNERLFVSSEAKVLGAFPQALAIRQVGKGQRFGSTVYSSALERQGLSLIGQARDGTPRNDPNAVKLVTEVYPLMNASAPMTLDVYVGAQDFPQSPITWNGPYPYNPKTQEKIDCWIEGKYIAVKFESAAEVDWELSGFGLKLDVVGEYA